MPTFVTQDGKVGCDGVGLLNCQIAIKIKECVHLILIYYLKIVVYPPPHTSEKAYKLQPIVPPPFGGSGQNRTTSKWKRKLANRRARKNESAIIDLGASGTYLIKNAHKLNERGDAPPIRVGTASGEYQGSSITCDIDITNIPSDFPVSGHVMTGFK